MLLRRRNGSFNRQPLNTRRPDKALCAGPLYDVSDIVRIFHRPAMRQGDHVGLYRARRVDQILGRLYRLVQGHGAPRAGRPAAGQPDMWDNHVHVGFGHLHAFLRGADVADRVQPKLSRAGDHFDFSGEAQSHQLEVVAYVSIEPRYSRIVDDAGKSGFAELLKKTAHISRRIGADVPSIAYESVPDLLRLPPDLYLGEVSRVALNSAGHIFVLHRGNSTGPAYGAAAAQLLEFDGNGDYQREIGHNLYAWSFAHTVKVDREDNVWVTNKGSDMVIKFTPEGRVDMVFGRKQEASDEDTAPLKHPNPPLPARDGIRQVTNVAWDGAGDAYISDGYINSRVAKVSKDGDWLEIVGRNAGRVRGSSTRLTASRSMRAAWSMSQTGATAASRCSTARALSSASSRSTLPCLRTPNLQSAIVPGEAEIAAGTFAPGAPWAICLSPPPNQVLYAADGFPGRVYKLTLDGKLLGMLGRSGKRLKQFGWISRDGVSGAERAVRRRASELAGAEALAGGLDAARMGPCAASPSLRNGALPDPG